MDAAIKAQWVAALRSGAYPQGTGVLRRRDTFCCLGVLCELHSKATSIPWAVPDFDGDESYLDAETQLPQTVAMWAGIEGEVDEEVGSGCSDPMDPNVRVGGISAPLSEHNDGASAGKVPKRTFAEIATAIEESRI